MASGTQGYEAAQSDVIGKIIDRFKNRKKDDKEGKGDKDPKDPGQPASVSIATPTSSMLIEGTTVNKLMSGTSALATTGSSDITKYGEDAVLQAQLSEQQQTNQLLTAQNQLLLSASTDGVLSKFDRQESELEKIEDLSGTINPEKVKKPTWLGDLLKALGKVAFDIIAAIAAGFLANKVAIFAAAALSRRGIRLPTRNMINVTPSPRQLMSSTSNATNLINPAKNTVSSSSNLLDASKLTQINDAIPNTNFVNQAKEPVLEGVSTGNKVVDTATNINKGVDASEAVVDIGAEVIPYKPNKIVQTFDGMKDFLNPMNSLKKLKNANTALRGSGAAHAIPLLSAVTGTVSLMTGDYANAMLDYADAGADAAIIGGATGTAGMLAAGLSSAATVLSVGTLTGYIGEWTRGVDDWIRGDGNNIVMNGIADVTAGLSSGLEILGTPFRGLFEGINSLIKHGDFSQSNETMAVIDANIRESARKFLNIWDPLGIIPDEVGGFGTLSAYGEENVANANQKLLESKGVNPGEVKNASGGSYFLDNPTNMGPFQGGEASGEVVTFTPFGGRGLVNEMGQHMTDALQMPFQFAIGGIAAAINQVIGTLGPMGQFLKSAVGPSLGKLVKASGLTNLSLGGVSTGIGNLLTGAPANAGGVFGNLMTGNTGGAEQMAQMFTGQREETDYSAVLPQGRPVLTSKFGPRNLSYGSNDHKGIDIGVDRGSPVTSMEDGTVTSIIPDFMHGSAVVVTSDAGDATLYGHVDPTVEKGQEVSKGETIAKVKYWPGTGDMAADNTHLHLERHPGGYDGLSSAVDPLEFTKNSSKTLNQSENITPSDNTGNNIEAPKTVGSLFMPNINNKELSQEALILAQGQQQLMGALQTMQKSGFSGSGGSDKSGESSGGSNFMQPQTDPYASIYAPLHLSRLGTA